MEAAALLALIQAASLGVREGLRILEERRRNRELTPEQEAQLDAFQAEQFASPHWQVRSRA